jgi:hypothetical protein
LLNSKKDLKVKSENETHKYIKNKAPRELRGALLVNRPSIVLRRFCESDRPTRSGAVQGRVALGSAFLLLAFQ